MKSPTEKTAIANRRSLKLNDESRYKELDLVFPPAFSPVVLGRDASLEKTAREILSALGAEELAREVHVEWNARLFSAAGRADSHRNLISLNPRLREHDTAEIDRTLRHELAHLLAQFRAGEMMPQGPHSRCGHDGVANPVG